MLFIDGRLRLSEVLLPGGVRTRTGVLVFTMDPVNITGGSQCPGRELGVCWALCPGFSPGVNLVWLPSGQGV